MTTASGVTATPAWRTTRRLESKRMGNGRCQSDHRRAISAGTARGVGSMPKKATPRGPSQRAGVISGDGAVGGEEDQDGRGPPGPLRGGVDVAIRVEQAQFLHR